MGKKKFQLPKLSKNNNGYYELKFRISVKLVPFFNKKHIIKSLECKNLKTAERKALLYYNEYLKILHHFNILSSDIQIQKMVDSYIQDIIKQTSERTINYSSLKVKTYGDAMDKFLIWYNNKEITDNSKKYINQFVSRVFIPLVGSDNIITTDIADVVDIKNKLQNFPNRNYKEYRHLPIKEILKLKNIPNDKKISDARLKSYIKNVKLFFKFCYRNKYIDFNPAEDVTVLLDNSTKRRLPFEAEEMKHLLSVIVNLQSNLKYLYLIYAFTGMRREEAFKCKYKVEDGIPYFDLSANQGFKLKTNSSYRRIPVHKTLLDLGLNEELLEEAKRITSVGETGRQFNANVKTQVTNNSKKTLHSLRHTVNNFLKRAGVDTLVREELLGHEHTGTNNTIYSEDFPLEFLQQELNKLDYNWP